MSCYLEKILTLLFVTQGSSTKDYFLNRTMQSLECYFYLIVFNAYLHEQVTFLVVRISLLMFVTKTMS